MIKSSWAYRNGKRMMNQAKERKQDKISFVKRQAGKLYAEYGVVKTYANKKQADNKIQELRVLGYSVNRSVKHPFTIILEEM